MLSARILGTYGRAGTPPPGRLSPLGVGGIIGCSELAVAEGPLWGEQPTADCIPLFLFLWREGEESPMAAPPTSVSPRRVAMKVVGLGDSADLTCEYRFFPIGRDSTAAEILLHRPESISTYENRRPI